MTRKEDFLEWNSFLQAKVFVVFVLLNLLLMLWAVSDGAYVAAADVAVSMEPARSLLQGNGFAHPDGSFFTWGTPLYPIFLAGFLGVLPWGWAIYVIVFVQCTLLYLTGLMVRQLTMLFLPQAATLAFIIYVLNPNVLITAHLLQTETLFVFLFMAGVVSMFKYADCRLIRYAISTGCCMGLATLVRPVGQFVILLLPILFGLFGLYRREGSLLRTLGCGLLALGVALVVISPWLVRNHSLFGVPLLTTNAGMYLEAQYRQLLHNGYGMGDSETGVAAQGKEQRLLEAEGIDAAAWKKMSPVEKSRLHSKIYLEAIREVPAAGHVKALLHSLVELYFAGGASNIRNYLGIEGKRAIVEFQGETRVSFSDALARLISRIDYGYALLLALTLGYTLVMRLVGVAGLIAMLRKERVAHTLAILMIMTVLTLSYLYLGQSRFRLPLEPFLSIMAAVGFFSIAGWRLNKNPIAHE